MALAGILLVPALATLWTAWGKLADPVPPDPTPLTLAAAGALARTVRSRPVHDSSQTTALSLL